MSVDQILLQMGYTIVPDHYKEGYYCLRKDGEDDPISLDYEGLKFIWELISSCKPTHVVETGTYHGVTTAIIAKAMENNPDTYIITFDKNSNLTKARKNWEKIKVYPDAVIGEGSRYPFSTIFNVETLDLVIANCADRLKAINNLLPFLKRGGLILLPDSIVIEDFAKIKIGGVVGPVIIPTSRGLSLYQKM